MHAPRQIKVDGSKPREDRGNGGGGARYSTRCYVRNTVKDFEWKPQGNRRLPEKPKPRGVNACLPLATAAQASVHSGRIPMARSHLVPEM